MSLYSFATDRFPVVKQVEETNRKRLAALQGHQWTYVASDGGHLKQPGLRNKLIEKMMVPRDLQLKEGAQVMLTKNYNECLVNGSVGVVVAFLGADDYQGQCLGQVVKRPLLGPRVYPVVRFSTRKAGGVIVQRNVLVQSDSWTVEDGQTGATQLSRPQVNEARTLGKNHSSYFTALEATLDIGMGSHHPQVTGTDTGQGKDRSE